MFDSAALNLTLACVNRIPQKCQMSHLNDGQQMRWHQLLIDSGTLFTFLVNPTSTKWATGPICRYRPTAITSNMVLKQATLYGGIVTTQLYPIETARVKSLLFPLMLTVVASQDFNSFSQPDQIFPTFLDAFPSLDFCTILLNFVATDFYAPFNSPH